MISIDHNVIRGHGLFGIGYFYLLNMLGLSHGFHCLSVSVSVCLSVTFSLRLLDAILRNVRGRCLGMFPCVVVILKTKI